MNEEKKVNYAIEKLCEADIVFRLGAPFRQLARYTMQGSKGQDLMVDYKDFKVEGKYWRYWFGGTGKQKLIWKDAFQKDFDWLCNEIDLGFKGKRAFIAFWSPYISWNELLQLGERSGNNPQPNRNRLRLLPFLECPFGEGVSSIRTNYTEKVGSFTLRDWKAQPTKIDWRLYGEASDFINIVFYY